MRGWRRGTCTHKNGRGIHFESSYLVSTGVEGVKRVEDIHLSRTHATILYFILSPSMIHVLASLLLLSAIATPTPLFTSRFASHTSELKGNLK